MERMMPKAIRTIENVNAIAAFRYTYGLSFPMRKKIRPGIKDAKIVRTQRSVDWVFSSAVGAPIMDGVPTSVGRG
jgi:hypothetical protein